MVTESQRQVQLSVVITDPSSGGAPRPFTLLLNTHSNSAGIIHTSFAYATNLFYVVQTLQMTLRLRLIIN